MDIVKNKKKIFFNEINIMRGMAVLCVVIGHSFNATATPTILGYVKSFVYCFHMPAFFFISGFLANNNKFNCFEKKNNIKKKFKRLMIPYFSLTILTVVLKTIFGIFAKNPLNYNTLIIDILIGRNNPNGGLWFLYALFIISVIGILISGVDEKKIFFLTFLLYLFNIFLLNLEGECLAFFLNYSWYYFGGMLFRKFYLNIKNELKIFNRKSGWLYTIILILTYLLLAYFRIYKLDNLYFNILITVLGVLLLFLLAYLVNMLNISEKFFDLVGNYGMDIYMIGYYVQQGIYVILGKIFGVEYYIYSWCMLVLGLILPIVISKYIVRKSKILSYLILGA